jgi:hypothetical protein
MPQTCPYCREAIPESGLVECPACNTPHHHDCWMENGGCTVFGCEHAPADDPKIAVSASEAGRPVILSTPNPVSYLVSRAGQQFGPYTMQEIRRYQAEGRFDPGDLAWSEGMTQWIPLSQVLARTQSPPLPPRLSAIPGYSVGTPAVADAGPLFFYIPVSRLVIMGLASFGLFEAFWIYRNWRFLKRRDHLDIQPFWRGIFGVFFVHGLLSAIKEDRKTTQIIRASFSAGSLATGWVVLHVAGYLLNRLGNPSVALLGTAIAIPSFLFFVPVQRHVNAVNEIASPGRQFDGWSTGHIVCLVIGIILWLLILAGLGA